MHIVTDGQAGYAIQARYSGATIGLTAKEGEVNFIADNKSTEIGINNSAPSQALKLSKQLREEFHEELGASGTARNYLYTAFNGVQFAPWVEIIPYTHMMNDNVGKEIGFSGGIAAPINREPDFLADVASVLGTLDYRGEIALGVNEEGGLASVFLGHHIGFFSLYSEIVRADMFVKFLIGELEELTAYNCVALAVTLSTEGFPFIAPKYRVQIPVNAEKHFWRMPYSKELDLFVIMSLHDGSISTVRRRFFNYIGNVSAKPGALQYRTDIGRRSTFLYAIPPRAEERIDFTSAANS